MCLWYIIIDISNHLSVFISQESDNIVRWKQSANSKQQVHKLFPPIDKQGLISWWLWMIDILFELQSFGPVCDRKFYWGAMTQWRG